MSAASDVRRIQTIESTIGSLIVRLAELRERVEKLEQRIDRLETGAANLPYLAKTKHATS